MEEDIKKIKKGLENHVTRLVEHELALRQLYQRVKWLTVAVWALCIAAFAQQLLIILRY